MRKFAAAMPILALVAGVIGFFLRRRELATVFDDVTGLAQRSAPVSLALIGLVAAAVIIFLVFSITAFGGKAARGQMSSLRHTGPINLAVLLVLGAAWLVSAVMYYLNIRAAGEFPMVETYFAALSALSGLSVAALAFAEYRSERGSVRLLLSVIPALFMCFWLVLLYKQNAANPVLLSYCYQCLAILTSALSFYFAAGYVFGKAAPGKTIFSFLITIFFCCIALADNLATELKAVFAIVIIMQLLNSMMLIKKLGDGRGRHQA